MINLLPLEKKQKLLSKKRTMLIVIFLVLMFLFLACFAFMLFFIATYSQINIESKKISFLAEEKELKKSEAMDFQKQVEKTNLELRKIDSFYNKEIYISETLEKISQILPEGVYLTDLSAKYYLKKTVSSLKEDEEEEKYGINFSVSGFAIDRETLISFKQEIEKEETFTEVFFPLENLLKQKDIDFTITFKTEQ